MRIGIREQFAAVVLFTALVPLMVLSIATWINNHDFVTGLTSQQLALTANLKASQISSDLLLIQSTCNSITTRVLIQNALRNYYRGNTSESNWTLASVDIMGALAGGGLSALLQVAIFSRNATGNSTSLFRATGNFPGIIIPNSPSPDGTEVQLGQDGFGYPPSLYPNITYTSTLSPDPADPRINATSVTAFSDFPLNRTSVLVLGPLQINSTYALLSMTLPIVDNDSPDIVLGFMTVVAAATSLLDVIYQYREGLAKTGIVLLVSTNRKENLFRYGQKPATKFREPTLGALNQTPVKYVFPPYGIGADRHTAYLANFTRYGSSNFSMGSYPAVVAGFGTWNDNPNNAGNLLSTRNEDGSSVSVGYARPHSTLVDWLLIVEQTHKEAWAPVEKLRRIVLACVFGSIGLILLVLVPTAHYSVLPILRLKAATKKSITPPGYTPNGSISCGRGGGSGDVDMSDGEPGIERTQSMRSKKDLFVRLRHMAFGGRMEASSSPGDDDRRRGFKIPAKVKDRKHFITDELTELTATFNEMTEELMAQYTSLEDKVAQRTRELEISKKAAEAANESKTLFIANISHELKTPLNGILGMAAVCMGEDDLPRIKKSLQVVYKSGDLLLHLLNDLLTFSKNQIGQQLSLEEREFRLNDIKVQIVAIFTKQVQEKNIHFSVKFVGVETELDSTDVMSEKTKLPALGPQGTGRLKDMHLWGDQHRILQVIINLVSNSLKFTPAGGRVLVRIKCLGEGEHSLEGRRNSLGSKQSKQNSFRGPRGRLDSGSNTSQVSRMPSNSSSKPSGTALQINPMDPKAAPRVQVRERSPTPPPPNSQTLIFQFEVEDSGPGIPESLQDRVFEPFVQGDLGLSKKYGGTGLGLSICSQLSQLMGGTITLTSSQTAPTGTTFTVQIPLRHTKSRAPSTSSSDMHAHSRPNSMYNKQADGAVGNGPGSANTSARNSGDFQKGNQPRLVGLSQPFFATTSPATPDGKTKKGELSVLNKVANGKEPVRKLRVLVAEDNLVNQEIVIRMLKLEHLYDVEVVVAQDGKEAYDVVKESMESGKYFNLIFMDIQMPNLDGLQSTKLIRQMGYSAPIVALTAFSEESNVKECYDSGMDHFLSKPIRRPALKQVLKQFATIPEEAETSSGKSTPSEHDASSRELGTSASSPPSATEATTTTAIDTAPPTAVVNGTSPSKEAPP
ncbi:histidine kinase-group VI protein [Amylocarpus encephaloides]|uniref:histidine kinase n=1 Tax=Amylocarpus encephaloides TaxID=45428 RepID=A0A9P7YJJ2_9HELO|nr:histidine kinase-group VI protein [Amylocarpus encephaloides]